MMNAYVVVDLTPQDKEKMQQYSAAAAATIAEYQGEFIAKGGIEALSNEPLGQNELSFSTKVIIQFPNKEKALAWYQSDAYQKIIPIRDQGMKSQFHLVG
jgi:uncharacterized protein (DUF1330 family)